MSEESGRDLALKAIKALEGLVKTISTRYQHRDLNLFRPCQLLSGHLAEAHLWLDGEASPDPFTLANILVLLESICKGSSPPKPAPTTTEPGQVTEQYPELCKLVIKRWHKDARTSIEKLFSSSRTSKEKEARRKRQQKIHKRFDEILGQISQLESADVLEPETSTWDEDDFAAHLSTLHTVLSRYGVCKDSSVDIVPKISLSGYRRHDKSGSVFEMLFPHHPHQAEAKPCNWQNAAIHVGPKVTFQDKEGEQPVDRGIDYHEFCGTISGRQQEQLFLTVSRQECKLHQSTHPDSIGKAAWMLTAPDSPGFSLRNILANGELVGSTPAGELLRIDTAHVKVKIILFYLLTKGVWQFFDSELMPDEWTKDTVEFLVEYREHRGALTAGVFLNQPLIPAQLNSAPKEQEEALNHSFPKIRELGIMLLEILLGRQIESFRGLPEFAAYLPGGRPTPYTDSSIATWLFNKRVKMDQQIAKPLINVIERCLDPVFFPKLLAPGKSKDQADNGLRDAMYEKLVAPLDLLVKTNYDNTHGLWPLHELSAAAAAPHHGAGTTEPPLVSEGQNTARTRTDIESETSPHSGEPSQRWFDDLDVVKALLLAGHSPRRVRVAVIDTGFSPQWGAIPWNIQQGNYKDFVDALDDDRRDDTGHGTYLARLICKIMPKVELYAARVLKDGLLSEESCELVENAIDWAAGKEVDIILMASGGNKDYDNVRRAINRLPDTTLFVAAAGNLPQCRRVTFPARMQRNVMCIFAATANNKNSRALNPPPLSRGYSFAMLGEAVQPEGNWGNPQSGTSYAAAIAAAFAGMLLHFSWQALPEGENDPLDLQHYLHERMNPIFEELSKNQQDGGYECISPSHLLNIIREEFTEQEKRRKIRNFLSDVIAQQRS